MLTGKDVILVMWPPYRKDWCFLPSVKEAHFYAGLLLVSNSLRNSWANPAYQNFTCTVEGGNTLKLTSGTLGTGSSVTVRATLEHSIATALHLLDEATIT